ncbi:membrane protein [Arthrobacter phage Qui]|jgi:hypothetical protein|uniref:Membrane protein n=1 Tax=Arthrobacter phage Qui TaxID=2603260 RepID=A0A5B8WIE5_9CAUD|nr:membrane protein [Arthrobacter phage Qui]QED11537.1 membrane protein [Arthrobacter phage Qui]QOC56369.1 membrane protein [Arthrobacter phage Paella]
MSDHSAKSSGFLLSDSTYNVLQRFVEVLLPGVGAFYFGAAAIWGAAIFPNADKVTGTIALLVVFLGLVLRVSRKNYTPPEIAAPTVGAFVVNTTDVNAAPYRLEMPNHTFEDLEAKQGEKITLEVKNSAS